MNFLIFQLWRRNLKQPRSSVKTLRYAVHHHLLLHISLTIIFTFCIQVRSKGLLWQAVKTQMKMQHFITLRQNVGWLVWFFTSKSTAMVMSGRSVHLGNFFPEQAWLNKTVNKYFVHILLLLTGNNPSWISVRERMTIEISAKVVDQAWIELATPGLWSDTLWTVRHILRPNFCIHETSKCLLWQAMKTQIKCCIMQNFITVYTVC